MTTENITFVFTPADGEDYPNTIEFTYEITKGDYEAFTNYANNMCDHNLTQKEIRIILKTYPKLKKRIEKNEGKHYTIGDVFEQSCCFVGVTKISKRKYEIDYDT